MLRKIFWDKYVISRPGCKTTEYFKGGTASFRYRVHLISACILAYNLRFVPHKRESETLMSIHIDRRVKVVSILDVYLPFGDQGWEQ